MTKTGKAGRRNDDAYKTAADAIHLAHTKVEDLMKLAGDTPERWSLRGSCWKRLAQISRGDVRADALRKMAECHRSGMMPGDKGHFYRQLQWATAHIALALSTQGARVVEEVEQVVKKVAELPADKLDSWRDISSADARLLGAIVDRSIIERKKEAEILAAYRKAWGFGGSPLNLMSVLEQFSFFEDVLADSPGDVRTIAETLGRMRGTLESHLRSSSRGTVWAPRSPRPPTIRR